MNMDIYGVLADQSWSLNNGRFIAGGKTGTKTEEEENEEEKNNNK